MTSFVELETSGIKLGDIVVARKDVRREPFASARSRLWLTGKIGEDTDLGDLPIRPINPDGTVGTRRFVKTEENMWDGKATLKLAKVLASLSVEPSK